MDCYETFVQTFMVPRWWILLTLVNSCLFFLAPLWGWHLWFSKYLHNYEMEWNVQPIFRVPRWYILKTFSNPLTFWFFSEIFRQLLDELQWNSQHMFMFPRGWRVITLISWPFIQHHHPTKILICLILWFITKYQLY